jgi:hypothetical protein
MDINQHSMASIREYDSNNVHMRRVTNFDQVRPYVNPYGNAEHDNSLNELVQDLMPALKPTAKESKSVRTKATYQVPQFKKTKSIKDEPHIKNKTMSNITIIDKMSERENRMKEKYFNK